MERLKTMFGIVFFVFVICLGGNARAEEESVRAGMSLMPGTVGVFDPAASGYQKDGLYALLIRSNKSAADFTSHESCGQPQVMVAEGKAELLPLKWEDGAYGKVWRIMVVRQINEPNKVVLKLLSKCVGARVIIRFGWMNATLGDQGALAMRRAHEAERIARSASHGGKNWGKLSLGISGLYAFETAGKPGGGALLSLTGDLWRPGRFFRLGLGVQANLVAYQLEFRGPADHLVNPDESALQIDVAAYIEPRVDLWGWGSLYLQTGFGGRVLIMPDAIPFQEDNGWVKQIEGGTDAGGIWFLRLGGTFWFHPSSPIGLDISYLLSVSLNKMVQNPGGVIPYEHHKAHIWTHALVGGLKARW